MLRSLVAFCLLAASSAALAQDCDVAIVDFERAVTETQEGQAAQQRLDTMYSSKKAEIDQMRADLESDLADYQSRALILSEEARADTEQALMEKQQRFESTYMQYQQEMQQTYFTLLQDLDSKMRAMTGEIAKERGCTVVVDRAVVVYAGPKATDLTNILIQRYDAQ